MNTVKKLIALALVAVSLFSFVACQGSFYYPTDVENTKTNSDGEYVPPEMNDDPTDDFTVTLTANISILGE